MPDSDLREAAPTGTVAIRELESPAVRLIRPVKRRIRLVDVLRGGQVIRVITARDFKVKYKQSLLGPLWLLFQPIALLAGFFVAFRNLANVQPGIPYSVFALVGLTVWSFFQASLTIGTAAIVGNNILVRFTPCPRFAFPIAGILASLPAWAITAIGALIAAVATGTLSPRVLLLPLGLVWLFLLTAGVVALTSSLTVRYRDMLSVMPFLLQVGLFLAPIGYPLSKLGGTVRPLVELNPLTGIVEACRWMVVANYTVAPRIVVFSLLVTGIVVVLGWRTFARLEATMGDEI